MVVHDLSMSFDPLPFFPAARLTLRAEPLDEIPYVDRPDIEIPATADTTNGAGPSESVSMPFKYVEGGDGEPILPDVSFRLFGACARLFLVVSG